MELSDGELRALWDKVSIDFALDDRGELAYLRFARAVLAAHEAKKQQDHQTQPCGVRTEPGEENARGVLGTPADQQEKNHG